ncbi:Glycinol 4-dimethylallyltransferase [Spatholobus suberectus]|nr:Glycinol 4-dimethylallyltransferase [Spatholobus suberectus]
MDSVSVISSPYACSVTTGGNLGRRKHSTKNIYYASSFASKASQHKRKTHTEYNLLRFQQPNLNHHYKSIEGVSTYQECNRKYILKAIPRQSFDSEPHGSEPKNIFDSIKNFLVALYWFCYPYTMIGRTFSTISASLLVVEKLSDISPLFFIGVLQALVPYLFMDFYANGVNQLFDLEIDKINKPYLPLASGQLSFTTGVIISVSSAILSFWLSWIIGSWPLIWSLVVFFLLWSGYSINAPLLRWKRHPLLAAMCIFATLALIFPISFFFHMQTFVFKRPAVFSRSLMFVVVFLSLYSSGIALFKDIPDIEGDKAFGIHSFSARLGQKRVFFRIHLSKFGCALLYIPWLFLNNLCQVFWLCISIFEMAFGVAFLAIATSSSCLWIKIATGLGHAVLASVLWYKAKYVDLSSKASIRSFYMLIWKVIYS